MWVLKFIFMKINKLRFKKNVYGLQQGRLINKLTQTQKL